MNIISIRPHSIVSLITNSSSELYVIEGKKTINTVKAILTNVVKLYDRANGTSYSNVLFTEVFKEPTLVKWFFDFDSHRTLVEQISVLNPISRYNDEENYNEEYAQLCNLDIDLMREHVSSLERQPSNEARDVALHAARALVRERLAPHIQRYFEPLVALDKLLLRHFAEDNNLTQEQISRVLEVVDFNQHSVHYHGGRVPYENEQADILEFLTEYRSAIQWSMPSKKGDIFLESATDNSVPYQLNDTICALLSAQRYHLG